MPSLSPSLSPLPTQTLPSFLLLYKSSNQSPFQSSNSPIFRHRQSIITQSEPYHMAMEQYLQETLPQNHFNKEDAASLNKWKSLSEAVVDSQNGLSGGFDCNICLDPVHDPVVTLCGHLYCWPCIYKWIHHQSTSSEYPDKKKPLCPVCKNEVSQKTIVPLYGRGQTTKPRSGKNAPDLGIKIPCRPPSPRCGFNAIPAHQLNYRSYQQVAPPPIAMPGLGGMTMTNMINPTSPTTGMLGEVVYETIFGNTQPTLFVYPNSYNLAGISTQRARRHAMQADRSLSRICFFLLCGITLCLLLF